MGKNNIYKVINEYYGIRAQKIEVINRLFLRQSYMIFDGEGWIVLKKYPPYFDENLLENIWMFASSLNQEGITTVEAIKMKNNSFICRDEAACYVAYKYIDGCRMGVNDSFDIGRMLKKFHDASRRITCEKFKNFHRMIHIEKVMEDIQKFSLYQEKAEVAKYIHDNIHVIMQCINSYELRDKIIIHGDFTLNNVLNCEKEIGIIDLDSIRVGNAIEDIACFSLSLLYTEGMNLKLSPRYKEIANFIWGYYQNSSIPENIVDELCENLKMHCIIELAEQAQNFLIARRYPGNEEYIGMLADVAISQADKLKLYLKKYF